MFALNNSYHKIGMSLLLITLFVTSCITTSSHKDFWGRVSPPKANVLRYVSGPEPESIDPQMTSSQSDARIHLSLFEGLVEYHPKTSEPIPAIAERWESNADKSEFTFYLRKNARWSNSNPITAKDFVYSFRRGLNPKTASRTAKLGYYIKYARDFNNKSVFVKTNGKEEYVLSKDVEEERSTTQPVNSKSQSENKAEINETAFHQFINSPTRLTLPGDIKERNKIIDSNPKIKSAVAGKEFVPVNEEQIGVEAIDDYTFRITLSQSAPYFVGMLAHQFFRAVPKKAIEEHGMYWTQPENIITSGAFTLKKWIPYDVIHVVRDPMYWDVGNVKLDEIYFYPIEDQSTIFFLYTAGEIEGMSNHSVLSDWIDKIRPMKDWMNAPEAAITYYRINCTKPPMNDKRVRQAFSLAIDRDALVAARRYIVKPAKGFVPPVFNGYPDLKKEKFDTDLAKKLLIEAGYKDAKGNYDPSKFPVSEVELTYNTSESNRQIAEFVQSQWNQNLGINVRLQNMEFTTFQKVRSALEYKGVASSAWSADFLDPFTFLGLFYTTGGDNGTGWSNPKYSALLDEANNSQDPKRRYELFGQAEEILLEEKPVIALTYTGTNWMKKPYLKGMYPNPQSMFAWKYVYIERDPAKWDYSMPDMTRYEGE